MRLTVGEWSGEYALRVTSAPRAYDGFGTIEVHDKWWHDGNDARLVLIRDEHLGWQESRYGSGLHYSSLPELDAETCREIERHLVSRLTGAA